MRIGIIGAGQLGQMLGYAARDLDMQCVFIDPSSSPPAAACGEVIQAAFDDADALSRLAESCDLVTYEFENVPVEALAAIGSRVPVYPPPAALQHAQDRLKEKQLFGRLDIPLPAFQGVDSKADLEAAAETIGLPLVLKTRRFGYDGKGQYLVRTAADIDAAWQALGGVALIAEQWVNFDYEVSAIGARNPDGNIISYPLTQNQHIDGILHSSRAPLANEALTLLAEQYLRRLLEELDYVGVLALELFVVRGSAAGQRICAARAQLRALEHRRRATQSIHRAFACHKQRQAGDTSGARPRGHAQPDRRYSASGPRAEMRCFA